jgi:hypothetical protein
MISFAHLFEYEQFEEWGKLEHPYGMFVWM